MPSLLNTVKSGGTISGMNAMWTGMTFWLMIAIASKPMMMRYLVVVTAFWLAVWMMGSSGSSESPEPPEPPELPEPPEPPAPTVAGWLLGALLALTRASNRLARI